jgi:hypothetical protein
MAELFYILRKYKKSYLSYKKGTTPLTGEIGGEA